MVVESMDYKEIIQEYKKDFKEDLVYKITKYLDEGKYKRFILQNVKSETHYYFKPIFLTSKRGNKYVLHISTRGWKDFKKNGLLFILYMCYKRKDGIHVVMPNRSMSLNLNNGFMFYTSHLFDRYREREMKDIHIPKMDAIIECMKWNCTLRFENVENEKHPNSVFASSPYGVILGTDLCDGNKLLKTYLSFEMLKGNQHSKKDELREGILEYMKRM